MKKFILAILLSLPLLANAIAAKSYIAMDLDGNVLLEKNADTKRPIASITKLITGKRNADLPPDELILVTEEDVKNGRMKSSPLRAGRTYSRKILLDLALVNSDNVAAIALGRTSPVQLELLPSTTYVEASGLNPHNQSTAREIAQFAISIYGTELSHVSVQSSVVIDHIIRKSTNPLISSSSWTFYLSKTGFTNPAGGCLVVITKIKEEIIAVAILGSTDTKQRWRDLAEIREKLGDSNFTKPSFKVSKKPIKKSKKSKKAKKTK